MGLTPENSVALKEGAIDGALARRRQGPRMGADKEAEAELSAKGMDDFFGGVIPQSSCRKTVLQQGHLCSL